MQIHQIDIVQDDQTGPIKSTRGTSQMKSLETLTLEKDMSRITIKIFFYVNKETKDPTRLLMNLLKEKMKNNDLITTLVIL